MHQLVAATAASAGVHSWFGRLCSAALQQPVSDVLPPCRGCGPHPFAPHPHRPSAGLLQRREGRRSPFPAAKHAFKLLLEEGQALDEANPSGQAGLGSGPTQQPQKCSLACMPASQLACGAWGAVMGGGHRGYWGWGWPAAAPHSLGSGPTPVPAACWRHLLQLHLHCPAAALLLLTMSSWGRCWRGCWRHPT